MSLILQQQEVLKYHTLHLEGLRPDVPVVLAALKSCARCKLLETGKKIHAYVNETGFNSHDYVSNSLVAMYAKCGSMADARAAFDRIESPSVVSWTPLLFGYVNSGEPEPALEMFGSMKKLGYPPNRVAFLAAVKACSRLAAEEEGRRTGDKVVKPRSLSRGREIHSEARSSGHDSDPLLASSLVDMYSKCGSMEEARSLFEAMNAPDVVAWNSIILGYAENGDGETALELFEKMQRSGTRSNDRTFVSAVKACGCLGNLTKTREIHSQVLESGMENNVFLASSLVNTYAKCGSLKEARKTFERMRVRDSVAWNAMILGYVEAGEFKLALNMFQKMQESSSCRPNRVSFVAALKACCGLGAVGIGRKLELDIFRWSMERDLALATSLVDFYGKCGCMGDAQRVFDSFPVDASSSSAAWNALIAGYSRQGNSRRVFELFRGMQGKLVEPDAITFMALLSACSHAGLVEEGTEYFRLMSSRYSVAPEPEHYGYMIELLGGANRLPEAVGMLKSVPVESRLSLWMTLLGACRKWRNVEVARVAFENALALDEKKASAYVLVATIFEEAGMWEESARVQAMREQMKN